MVDAKEFVELQSTTSEQKPIRLATVTALSENGTALVTFYGEQEQSQKSYSYLAWYAPTVGDAVVMVPMADTYVIYGNLRLNTDTPLHLISLEELNQILLGYVTTQVLNDAIADFITKVDADKLYAALSHTHSQYATSSSIDTKIQNYTGQANSSAPMYNASIDYNRFMNIEAMSNFKHSGSYLGFFGTTPTTKLSISTFDTSASTPINTVISYINQLVNLLKRYGLT